MPGSDALPCPVRISSNRIPGSRGTARSTPIMMTAPRPAFAQSTKQSGCKHQDIYPKNNLIDTDIPGPLIGLAMVLLILGPGRIAKIRRRVSGDSSIQAGIESSF